MSDSATKTTAPKKTTTPAAKKPAEEVKVSEGKNHQNVRFVIVTEGQGGASIGQVLKASLPNSTMIAVNTSNQDLDQIVGIPDQFKFKIGGENADGAGKNRNRAKMYFKNFSATNTYTKEKLGVIDTFIGYYEEILFHPTQQTIIIVCFSSDGGTGSGLGPMMTASLTNYMNTCKGFTYKDKEFAIDDVTNIIPRPVVIGLTPKCSVSAGATNLQNTIECFLDIQKSIDAGIGHYLIADNNLPASVEYKSTEEMFRIINSRICIPLVKFLGIELNSSIKCMDLQDKINTLRIPGASAFVSITNENLYAYVEPKGQSVTRSVLMLQQEKNENGEMEKAAMGLMRNLDVTSIDTTSVFFEIDKTGLKENVPKDLLEVSMIGFFGFKSLNSVVEDLRDNLHRVTVANDKKARTIDEQSIGFDSVSEDASALNDRFNAAKIEQSQVMDLF